jgi:hypothetical protein
MAVMLTVMFTLMCHISRETSMVYLFDFKDSYNSKRKRDSALMKNHNNDQQSLGLYL